MTIDRGGIRGHRRQRRRLRARARRAARSRRRGELTVWRARIRARCSTGIAWSGVALRRSASARARRRPRGARAGRAGALGRQRGGVRERRRARGRLRRGGRAYDEIGAKWTVWVHTGDDTGRRRCSSATATCSTPRPRRWRPTSLRTPRERPPADALSDWTAEGVARRRRRDQRPRLHVRRRLVLARPDTAAGRARCTSTSRSDGGEPVGCAAVARPRGATARSRWSPWYLRPAAGGSPAS